MRVSNVVLDIEGFMLRARGVFKTADTMTSILRTIDRIMEEKGLRELTPDSINIVLDELVRRGYNPGTIRRYYYCIKTYMEIMIGGYDVWRMKMVGRRVPAYYGREPDNLTVDEVRRLIERTYRRDRRIAYALMYTYARRPMEVLSLRWGDVDLDRGLITFLILKKARTEYATFKLEDWILEELRRYRGEVGVERSRSDRRVFNFTYEALNKGFKSDCMRAGIRVEGRRLSLHILRRSRITHLRMMGVPLEIVSRFLARHSDPAITIRYYRAVPEEEAELIPSTYEMLWGSKGEGGEKTGGRVAG
jgi:integrase